MHGRLNLAAPALATGREARPAPLAWRWAPLLVLAALIPLVWPAVPPLTDLPAHMSRYLVQMDAGSSADIARWYSFSWNLIPNIGADLMAWVLEPRIGLEPTMKAIAMTIVALQVAGYLLLARAAHGQLAAPALFALPLAYGNPFQYGFLNFTLATALATIALAGWISPALRARPALRWLIYVPVACVVWVCHLAGWATLCVGVGCCELAARYERDPRLVQALWGGLLASSCLLVPQFAAMLWPDAPARLPSAGFFDIMSKLYHLFNVLADRWTWFDKAGAVALIVLIQFTWRSPAFALHRGLALSAAVLFALFWLMPSWVFGSFYADMRLTPTILALALIAVRPVAPIRGGRWLLFAALAFCALRLAGNTVSMAMWDTRIRAETAVLDALPRGSQLVSMSALPCRAFELQGRIRDMHIASYALTRRHAFASDQFSMSGGQLLTIHNPAAGRFDRDPSTIQMGEPCPVAVDLVDSAAQVPAAIPYLWIVWHVPQRKLAGWEPMARSGASVLYRRGPG